MIAQASVAEVLQAAWTVTLCVVLVILECLLVALVCAPRAVLRWLRSRLRRAGDRLRVLLDPHLPTVRSRRGDMIGPRRL